MEQGRVEAETRVVTGRGGNPPGQGPFLDLTLSLHNGIIITATYETYQCPGAHACGQAICEMVIGKGVAEAGAIRHEDLVTHVGPLPAHRRHCYGLALLALADSIKKT